MNIEFQSEMLKGTDNTRAFCVATGRDIEEADIGIWSEFDCVKRGPSGRALLIVAMDPRVSCKAKNISNT